MTDTSTVLLLLSAMLGAVVIVVVFNSSKKDDRSSEIAELQKTVRLLIERTQPVVTPTPSLQAPMFNFTDNPSAHRQGTNASNGSSTRSGTKQKSLSPRSSNSIPTSPPALALSGADVPALERRPSSLTAAAVPVSVYTEVLQLQDAIKTLERRNRELSRQLTLQEVSNVVDIEHKYGLTGAGGAEVKLTPSEVETIRAIFNLFDVQQKGSISSADIQNLHTKLGERLTEEEAQSAAKELDPDGTGQVNFHQFLYWWFQTHKGGKKSSKYTERFKLIHAKINNDQFNVDRVITQDSGTPYTLEYRLNFYYKQPNSALRQISPWHDVPLFRVGAGAEGQIYNFVCEIPRYTRAKWEVSTSEPYNPIKQDTQHGKLRFYKHGDIMFNYGLFPQTWEDPSYVPDDTGCPGDNDPLDVLEIGARQLRTGEICAVKVLGVLALIDDGETDWKIIGISIRDALSSQLNDIDDVETHLPGTIKAIREYFRDYKSFSGKINTYALRAQAMPRHYAVKVIEDCHEHWKSLHLVMKRDVVHKVSASTQPANVPLAAGGEANTQTEHHVASSPSKTEKNEIPEQKEQKQQI